MGNVHHGLFTVTARHFTQNGKINLSRDLPLSIYRHELATDCTVTSVHSRKIYRDRRGTAPLILKLSTRCEWNFIFRQFYRRKKLKSQWIRGWVSPRECLGVLERRKISRGFLPQTVEIVAYLTKYIIQCTMQYYLLHCSWDADYKGNIPTLLYRTVVGCQLFSVTYCTLVVQLSVYATISYFSNMVSLNDDEIKSAEFQKHGIQIVHMKAVNRTSNAVAKFINTLQFI